VPTYKDISIPPNRSARPRRPAAPKAGVDPVPAAISVAARHAPRTMQIPPHHRYRAGERLRMLNGGRTLARAAAFCKVVSLLPYEGHGPLLYRVRSETEAFERIVAEADLSRNSETA